MHGLVAGYTSLKREDCLDAGVRAGHWLVAQQDDDGCYRKYETTVCRMSTTRVPSGRWRPWRVANAASFLAAARRNLDWALTSRQAAAGLPPMPLCQANHPSPTPLPTPFAASSKWPCCWARNAIFGLPKSPPAA